MSGDSGSSTVRSWMRCSMSRVSTFCMISVRHFS
jgi:hypothetical protein